MNNAYPLVSVIVPVYNVQAYLNKCVDSIIDQTYRALEIILVDDGSLDKSGTICDDYALKDSRIKVIHKKNGGLSDARNVGIDIAKGDFIAFVDSDDWLDINMYEVMINHALQQNADIVICGHNVVELDGSIKVKNKINKSVLYNYVEAVELILNDKIINSFAWDKIYKKELFKEIRYPKGRVFEDIATTYKLFHVAQSVYYINQSFYYYVRRENSICLIKDNKLNVKRNNDNFHAFYERYFFVADHPEYKRVLFFCANIALVKGINMLHYAISDPHLFDDSYFVRTIDELKLIDIKGNKLVSTKRRLEYLLFTLSKYAYKWVLSVYFNFLIKKRK